MSILIYEGKKNTDRWVPVYLASGGAAVTGILPTQATVQFATAGATSWNAYTLDTTNWREVGDGLYHVGIGASEWTGEGGYVAQVIATGAPTVPLYVEVRDRLLSETDDDVIAILARAANTGVKLAPTAIGTAQFQDYAIPAAAIATAAYTLIADYVLDEVATAHQATGSVGKYLTDMRQRLAGYIVLNTQNNTIEVYEEDGETLRFTLTKAQATGSPTITITPS